MIEGIISHQCHRNRCFQVGFDERLGDLLSNNSLPKSVQKSILQSMSILELEKKRINRQNSNLSDRPNSTTSIVSPSMISPEAPSQGILET